jgi:hypothetical protein
LSCRIIVSDCASEQKNADADAPQQYEQNARHGHRHGEVGKACMCWDNAGSQHGGDVEHAEYAESTSRDGAEQYRDSIENGSQAKERTH